MRERKRNKDNQPLGADILEGGRVDEREADEEDVRLRVRERTETVVVLLNERRNSDSE